MTIRVATVQFEPRPADKAYNLARIEHFTNAAARDAVQLVAFPELCLVGNRHLTKLSEEELSDIAEPEDGSSVTQIRALSERLDIGIAVGLLAEREGRLFNAYAVCLPDGAVHIHRKLHTVGYHGISEGDGYTVFDTPWGVRLGVLICFDNNIVENVRATALLGTQILLAPHQTGGTHTIVPFAENPLPLSVWENRATAPDTVRKAFAGPTGRDWLQLHLPTRAHDNGLFIVFSNGIGRDDDEVRTGNAMIVDPCGRIIAESRAIDDHMVTADLDLDLVSGSVGQWWTKARRPELYQPLTTARSSTSGTSSMPGTPRMPSTSGTPGAPSMPRASGASGTKPPSRQSPPPPTPQAQAQQRS
ncbi:nitrilase-related carbon-nitrogen hydrolase [Catenulispora rubra]|uniref:nitrilase-related carbon-nitrogen hydrolase n=1 Tax=Catenulispora rubra TaxID=280293 RepID=UPI0018924DFB|nr:nitrilase-related carbon-nitrogen hydrolase [Catenulispora rubra]